MIDSIRTDHEYELICWTMQKFDQGSAGWERLRRIRDWCNRNGALREGFPPGTEAEGKAWNDLVAECRRMAQ